MNPKQLLRSLRVLGLAGFTCFFFGGGGGSLWHGGHVTEQGTWLEAHTWDDRQARTKSNLGITGCPYWFKEAYKGT